MTVSVAAPINLPSRFQLDREIGRGGMAVVYRALDLHLDRFVAIKVLSPNLSNAMGIERFQREIALMAKLVHPGIVALFDSGEIDGRLYYVMPFVAGENLRARLTRERRMAVEDAAGFGADVAEALAYAHGAGIVHRDVKPENIFTVSGRAVLADFGIAHIAGQTTDGGDAELTSAGMVLGTAAYMSPEQANAEPLDGRSDLYSLGCVLYELLTGATPFEATTPVAMLVKHLNDRPQPVRERIPGLPPALDQIIMSLLEKNPAARPANAGEVARALRSALEPRDTAPVPAAPSDADRLVRDAQQAISLSVSAGSASRSHLEQAGIYLKRALALEPQNARALCVQATWYYTMSRRGFLPVEEGTTKGRELVLQALAADDRIPEIHDSLGKVALYYDDDAHAAARHLERAVALDPKHSEALRFQSVVYKVLGRTAEAVEIARTATNLAPKIPVTWNALGDALMAAGRNAEAVDALKRAIALQPGYAPALERMEIARTRLGEIEVAADVRAARLRVTEQSERADLLVKERGELGAAEAIRRDLERELAELLQKAETTDPFADYSQTRTLGDQIVLVYTMLGDWKQAMDWIERAYARRPVRLRRMLTEPPFDRRGLAADPRYARLLRAAVMEDLL